MLPKFPAWTRRNAWAAAVILLVLMAVCVRLRMLSMPLERDEGEYAYMGQLMLQGIPPYQLAFNIKMPGTYSAYALIMALFGESASGIHMGFLFVNLGTLALLYFLARRWLDEAGVLVCCAAYVLLSLSTAVLGLQAHATHLVMIHALGGLLLLLRARENGRRATMYLSGLLFGLSFLCKQPGLFFGLFGLTVLARDGWRAGAAQWRLSARSFLLLTLGLVTPVALACLILWRAGTFARFWFWTMTYARVHTGLVPVRYVLHRLAESASRGFERWLFLMAFAGWLWLLWQREQRRFLISAWFIFSLAAMVIGRYIAWHYFVVALPAVSLLLGAAVPGWAGALSNIKFPWLRFIPQGMFVILCACVVWSNRAVWFVEPPAVACAYIYPGFPFVECRQIGEFIGEHSTPQDTIAVVGSEPEIYFYARRHSVSGYIYMYDMVEPQPYARAMQAEFIHDVEKAQPEFLVLVNTGTSWMTWADADPALFKWINSYPRPLYDLIGVAEMYPDHTAYRWGREAAAEKTTNFNAIFTFKRK
jgi:hypothetical protein